MENHKITVRLPQNDLNYIDLFIKLGEFSTRSESIRYAINDFVKKYTDIVIEKANKAKVIQDLTTTNEIINSITCKNNV